MSLKTFNELKYQWQQETMYLSSANQMCNHPAYQAIIAMGKPVVPFILNELQKRTGHWFWALTEITGENPILPEHAGDMEAMRQDWLDWAKNNLTSEELKQVSSMSDEAIARVVHAAFRQMRIECGQNPKAIWDEVDEDEKEMFIDGVKYIREHPNTTAQQCHDLWMEVKAEQGYVQGDAKDDNAKVSTCFVPFDELSEGEKLKDVLFRDIVGALDTDFGKEEQNDSL